MILCGPPRYALFTTVLTSWALLLNGIVLKLTKQVLRHLEIQLSFAQQLSLL